MTFGLDRYMCTRGPGSGVRDEHVDLMAVINERVSFEQFFVHFRGDYKDGSFDSDRPPLIVLENSKSWAQFSDFLFLYDIAISPVSLGEENKQKTKKLEGRGQRKGEYRRQHSKNRNVYYHLFGTSGEKGFFMPDSWTVGFSLQFKNSDDVIIFAALRFAKH